MISGPELRKIARERQLPLDLIEKDYAIGWILIGISKTSLSDKLIFKGGTALSKVYFPLNWRISEDLDFTLSENTTLEDVSKKLLNELPNIVEKESGLTLKFRNIPFINPGFLRVRVQYTGPISRNQIKIEVSKEGFIGDFKKRKITTTYDYPEFNTLTYTLNTILAEKLRAIIERGHIRDYYDSWRLLKSNEIDHVKTKELFLKKCEAKNVKFHDMTQFFPTDLVETLEPYRHRGLTRLSSEPLPPLTQIIKELKTSLITLF